MAISVSTERTPKIFYGWILVFTLLMMLSVSLGTSIYMYSVVAGAVGEEFSANRSVLMLGSTGMLLTLGLSSPLVGTLLDRYPGKWILVAGNMAIGIGFILISLSTNIWMVVACYLFFIGVGAATVSTLTAATVLSRWFVRRIGLAIGIAALGTQLGGFVYPPIFAAVMEVYNWRIAIGGLGVLVILILPAMSWKLVTDHPGEKNLAPDGGSLPDRSMRSEKEQVSPPAPKLPFSQLITSRNFLLLVLIVGSGSATNVALMANLALFATDLGENPVRGAFLVSVAALLGVLSSPASGWLCDVFSIRKVTVLVPILMAVACMLFSIATTYEMLMVATFFLGLAGGGVFPIWGALVGKLYDTRVYGQAMGATTMIVACLTGLAPLLAGAIYDLTNSYRTVFLIFMVTLSGLALMTPLIHVPQTREEKIGFSNV